MTGLTKTLTRKITVQGATVVVEIGPEGLAFRGFGRRRRLRGDWARLVAATEDDGPLVARIEERAAARLLRSIGVGEGQEDRGQKDGGQEHGGRES